MLVLSQLKNDVIAVLSNGNDQDNLEFELKNNITKIVQNDQIIGFNFINLKLVDELGPISQTSELIDQLNQLLENSNFDYRLEIDNSAKFVVAHVQTVKPHPDSDHLNIVSLDLGNQDTTTVVSGSPNMQENIQVVAVRPGAIMPSGQIIFPGKLRGVDSDGMIASARELKIKNAPDKPGALILPTDWPQAIGDAFNFQEGQKIYG